MSESGKKFPFEKVWRFEGFEQQIKLEFGLFNWLKSVQEPQKAFWTFAWILEELLADDGEEKRIDVDEKLARKYLDLYWGTGELDAEPMERGLHALDIISREFTEQDELGNVCRGYDATREKKLGRWIVKPVVNPRIHHSYLMQYYKKMIPIMMKLWHKIGDQLEDITGFKLPTKDWFDHVQLREPTEEEKARDAAEDQAFWDKAIAEGRGLQREPEVAIVGSAIDVGDVEEEE